MPDLTRRERECILPLARGLTYEQIGDELGVSQSTVRTHLHHAYRKLGVRNSREAVRAIYDEPIKAELRHLQAELEQLRSQTTAEKLALRAFDALLAGQPHAAVGLRTAADELRARVGAPARPQTSPSDALDRILDRIRAVP